MHKTRAYILGLIFVFLTGFLTPAYAQQPLAQDPAAGGLAAPGGGGGLIDPTMAGMDPSLLAPPQQPVMYSVFWNTLWGSAWGGVMGTSYHLVSGINLRESVVTSITIGGLMGYGLGIFLVLNGLSFDPLFLLDLPAPQFGPQPQQAPLAWSPEKTSPTASLGNSDPSAWEATVINIRF